MKALLILPFALLSSCGTPFVGAITSPFGTAGYSSTDGATVVVDAGAIAEKILEVDPQK